MIKKLILLGFGLTLLIGLPLAIFVLQNQTTPTTGAAPVTKFGFDGPTTVPNGQPFDEKITVDPSSQNQVSFVKFTFTYDPAKLDKTATPIDIDQSKYTILEQPKVTCTDVLCTATATISIGNNTSAVIKTKTPIATMHFIAKANTDVGVPTQLAFIATQSQALSVGSADQPAENVFQTGIPASITIGDGGGGGGTPTDTPTPTGSGGGGGGGGGGGSGGGTGGGSGGGTGGSLSVTCVSLTPDKTAGNPPLAVTFTTVGNSGNDSITKIALNYGDGSVDTIASGSGIGTGNINSQTTHTYSGNGVFTASAILTTAGGATSDTTTCKQTITVGSTAQLTQAASGGKLPPTGPGQTILLIGIAGAVVSVIGGLALFGL